MGIAAIVDGIEDFVTFFDNEVFKKTNASPSRSFRSRNLTRRSDGIEAFPAPSAS
jgi:hypothetical protein